MDCIAVGYTPKDLNLVYDYSKRKIESFLRYEHRPGAKICARIIIRSYNLLHYNEKLSYIAISGMKFTKTGPFIESTPVPRGPGMSPKRNFRASPDDNDMASGTSDKRRRLDMTKSAAPNGVAAEQEPIAAMITTREDRLATLKQIALLEHSAFKLHVQAQRVMARDVSKKIQTARAADVISRGFPPLVELLTILALGPDGLATQFNADDNREARVSSLATSLGCLSRACEPGITTVWQAKLGAMLRSITQTWKPLVVMRAMGAVSSYKYDATKVSSNLPDQLIIHERSGRM
jgi:hypothetical protein